VVGKVEQIDQELIHVCEEFYRQLEGGDIRYFDLLDADIEFNSPFGDVHGHDGVASIFEMAGRAFDEPHPEPEEFVPAGDRLLVTGTWKGRAKATGISVEARFAHIVWFREGKICATHVYVDSAKVREAIEGEGTQ